MKGTELGIWVDEFDFSSATSQVDLNFEIVEAERTNLDSLAQEFIPILPKCTVTQNGYFEGIAATGFEHELEDRFGTGQAILTVLMQRSDADCVAYVLPEATDYSMVFGAPVANLVTLNGQWGTSAAAVRGRRVYDGTMSATGEQTAVDFGAGSTTGGKAYLHIKTITGSATNAAIKVQSSPDNNTWSDEGTFTFSAIGGYSLALSGTIGKYIRLNCTDLGGATSFRVMAVVSLG